MMAIPPSYDVYDRANRVRLEADLLALAGDPLPASHASFLESMALVLSISVVIDGGLSYSRAVEVMEEGASLAGRDHSALMRSRQMPITHEYADGQHRLVVDGVEGRWTALTMSALCVAYNRVFASEPVGPGAMPITYEMVSAKGIVAVTRDGVPHYMGRAYGAK